MPFGALEISANLIPTCHTRATGGCSYGNGMSRVAPRLKLKKLEIVFQHKVFKMPLAKGKIIGEMIAMLMKWGHSGFHLLRELHISPGSDGKGESGAIHYPGLVLRKRMKLDIGDKLI